MRGRGSCRPQPVSPCTPALSTAQCSPQYRAELDEALAASLLYEVTQKGHMTQAHTPVAAFPCTMPPGATSPQQRFETHPRLGHGDRFSEFRQAQGLRLCPGGGGCWNLVYSLTCGCPPGPTTSHSRVGAGGGEAGQ